VKDIEFRAAALSGELLPERHDRCFNQDENSGLAGSRRKL
jgi:hypothetical protein